MKDEDKIKVLVVDDHPMVLEGMRSMLAQISFANLIGVASNAWEAIEKIKEQLPDIVLTDINMPDVSGIELAEKIKKEFPSVKIVAMSTFKERSYISKMVLNGATGYLVKSASKEEIEEALLSVHEGRLYMSFDLEMSASEQREMKNVPVLSTREKEVLNLIADGLTNAQIAGALFISMHTVDSHRKNLLTKFGVKNTALLIRTATQYGLL
ncbi:MAG: DNA-binding response regulator [Sphingobacteriales bacterium SCN 48-20]|jgi:two-component system nitrate/nitrite response regulator NarL|uniref:response regulator transcription factor n=1 Tax=Terrimonas ferruginea TaxID=249 RepID=UPI00086DC0BB|nr:response regulator transcription factor [Terrimonas ferruginea]MBN8782147.1 response regulator transcription factor [Terrimonas ferruginea]ODT96004.1 MAG: DNA-binding response regulator [Sphingobacteriales bacterium SCN 48-20]OJW42685.1 MAG: DNA-binding response regulator [Sphingobacteriales bacterium 48-107]